MDKKIKFKILHIKDLQIQVMSQKLKHRKVTYMSMYSFVSACLSVYHLFATCVERPYLKAEECRKMVIEGKMLY